MHTARIAELLAPFLGPSAKPLPTPGHSERAPADEEPAVLSSAQLGSISTYIDLLIRWNARVNLTAIRDPEQIVTRHFGESFFAARHLFPDLSRVGRDRGRAARQGRVTGQEKTGALAPEAFSVADVGSGAGFPGLPIKLWASHISLTLLESNHKKAAFLREVSRALTLTDVNIQAVRAEALARRLFQVVTLRAVERFARILPAAANLVAPQGRLALLIGNAQLDQARALLPQFSWCQPETIPLSRSRVLLIGNRTES